MNGRALIAVTASFFVFVLLPYQYYRRSLRKSYSSSAQFPEVKIAIGASSDVGPRPSNEDAHLVHSDSYLLTAVFDGHCGPDASSAAVELFPRYFRHFPNTHEVFDRFSDINDNIKKRTHHGTTACCVFVRGTEIISANCGDSRAVVCRGGRAVGLSSDFKPSRASERARITTQGGHVRYVNFGVTRMFPGGLSVSRALGDRDHALVSGVPEVYSGTLSVLDEFYIIACDGVYDVMSSADVVYVVRQHRRDAQIRGIEQALALYNVDDTLFNNIGQMLLNLYGKTRMKLLRYFDDFIPSDGILQHADALAAKILSQKLVESALMRNTNDNVTCIVGLLRWPTTPKTVREWKRWAKTTQFSEKDVSYEMYFEVTHSANDESTEFWALDK